MLLKAFVKRYFPNIELGADSGGTIEDWNSDPK